MRTSLCAGILAGYFSIHCKNWLLSAGLTAVLLPAMASANLVLYDFDMTGGGFENAPETLVSGLFAGAWYDAASSLTDFAGNPGRSLAAKNWDGAGNALILEIVVAPGLQLDLDGYQFDQRASSSGPVDWQLFVLGSGVAAGSTTTGYTGATGLLSLAGLTGTTLIELRAGGASSAAGTWRIDNFQLTGQLTTLASPVTSVPLPGAAVFLVSGLLVTTYAGRRRS